MEEYKPKQDLLLRTTGGRLISACLALITVAATCELFSQGCSHKENLETLTTEQTESVQETTTYQDTTLAYQ